MIDGMNRFLALLVMLITATYAANAQFYRQRNDSTARIISQGVRAEVKKRTVTAPEDNKKSTKKNKKRVSAKKKAPTKKNMVAKSDTDKVRKPRKSAVKYSGRRYRLGERVIMQGDSGNDVKSLANILVERLFLDEKDIIYTTDGGVLYEGEIVRAVRIFQKVSGLYDDGMVGTPTLKALRKKK